LLLVFFSITNSKLRITSKFKYPVIRNY